MRLYTWVLLKISQKYNFLFQYLMNKYLDLDNNWSFLLEKEFIEKGIEFLSQKQIVLSHKSLQPDGVNL